MNVFSDRRNAALPATRALIVAAANRRADGEAEVAQHVRRATSHVGQVRRRCVHRDHRSRRQSKAKPIPTRMNAGMTGTREVSVIETAASQNAHAAIGTSPKRSLRAVLPQKVDGERQ
jgi:hypothetical protein